MLGLLALCIAGTGGVAYGIHERSASGGESQAYPRGCWRLGPAEALEHSVLFVSHILVRHREVARTEPAFVPPGWELSQPPFTRTRQQALQRAHEIYAQARSAPSTFAALAASYSDDVVTKDRGGSLGGVTASRFIENPQLLDALAALRPGQVSRVVETGYGYHVLMRRAPPPAARIAARRIVIGYAGAPWLEYQARNPAPATRTRRQATELAERVRAEALEHPASFEALAERYSETRDAVSGGDIGVWQNHEPSPFARELEEIAALEVGGITRPIDSALGVQIFQRVPVTEQPVVGASILKLPFNPLVDAGDPTSREATRTRADALLAQLGRDPKLLPTLQRQYCCQAPQRWSPGRADPQLLRAIEATALGAIAAVPVDSEQAWLILQRIAPPPAPLLSLELPEPATPDVAYFVRNAPQTALVTATRAVGESARRELRLSGEQAREVGRTCDDLALAFEHASQQEREEAFALAQARLKGALGAERFERFMQHVRANVAARLMGR